MYRPQFILADPPAGFVFQPCIFQFDSSNVPALGALTLTKGQESGYIPLPLDKDAGFILLAIKIQNSGVDVLLFDPDGNQLMDTYVQPCLYASDLPPATVLEGPGIEVLKGAVFSVRLQGQ